MFDRRFDVLRGDLRIGGRRCRRAGLDPDPGDEVERLSGSLAAAAMSSAATLAVIIPPSIPMILYAVMAETSVVQLFVAGIVPGVLGGSG